MLVSYVLTDIGLMGRAKMDELQGRAGRGV